MVFPYFPSDQSPFFLGSTPLVDSHSPCQIGLGRFVSTKHRLFSGSTFICERVLVMDWIIAPFPSMMCRLVGPGPCKLTSPIPAQVRYFFKVDGALKLGDWEH